MPQQITLTDDVEQDPTQDHKVHGSAIAWLSFSREGDKHLFHDFSDAMEHAEEMTEETAETTWEVYTLFAAAAIVVNAME